MGEERVDRMAAFMHHGGHVAHLTCGIHEDERRTAFGQRHIVSSRGLAFTAVQVQVPDGVHPPDAVGKERIQFMKAGDGLLQQFPAFPEWPEGLHARRFSLRIPGPQGIHAKLAAVGFIDIIHQRHHMAAHRLVELEALLRGIIEAAHFCELEIAVIRMVRVERDAVPFLHEFREELVQGVLVLQPSLIDLPVDLLPPGAVGILQIFRRLLQGEFLPVHFHGHFPRDLPVLLLEHIDLSLYGDVRFAVEFDVLLYVAQVGEVFLPVQVFEEGRCHQFTVQRIAVRLDPGLDLQAEIIKGLFPCLVRGIAGHADLPPAGILADSCFQFVHILQPLLQVLHVAQWPFGKFPEKRLEGLPIRDHKISRKVLPFDPADISRIFHANVFVAGLLPRGDLAIPWGSLFFSPVWPLPSLPPGLPLHRIPLPSRAA